MNFSTQDKDVWTEDGWKTVPVAVTEAMNALVVGDYDSFYPAITAQLVAHRYVEFRGTDSLAALFIELHAQASQGHEKHGHIYMPIVSYVCEGRQLVFGYDFMTVEYDADNHTVTVCAGMPQHGSEVNR